MTCQVIQLSLPETLPFSEAIFLCISRLFKKSQIYQKLNLYFLFPFFVILLLKSNPTSLLKWLSQTSLSPLNSQIHWCLFGAPSGCPLGSIRHYEPLPFFLDLSIPEACARSLSPIDFSWISLLPSVICGMLPKNRCSPKFGLSSSLLIL